MCGSSPNVEAWWLLVPLDRGTFRVSNVHPAGEKLLQAKHEYAGSLFDAVVEVCRATTASEYTQTQRIVVTQNLTEYTFLPTV